MSPDKWVLMTGGWDGDGYTFHMPCSRRVEVNWGRPVAELIANCDVHERICDMMTPRPDTKPRNP